MMKLSALLCFFFGATLLQAQVPSSKPEVWLMPPSSYDPPGQPLRDLFVHPEQWKEAQTKITVLSYTDYDLNGQFTDDELRTFFAMLEKCGIKLGLEVGAVKEWGLTGKGTFEGEVFQWDRFQSLGGKIDAIAMDRPLSCVRTVLQKPDSYAVEETAQFIALVRQRYPQVRIGDTEPYPSISLADQITWINALQAKLADMQERGLDFFRIDPDWSDPQAKWAEIKKIERACQAKQLPFSLVYWAADYPGLKSQGRVNDSTWLTSILHQGNVYEEAGGKPDQYIIKSPIVGVPTTSVPETDSNSLTGSTLAFCKRFVRDQE